MRFWIWHWLKHRIDDAEHCARRSYTQGERQHSGQRATDILQQWACAEAQVLSKSSQHIASPCISNSRLSNPAVEGICLLLINTSSSSSLAFNCGKHPSN